jgi:hypothetical protein
MFSITVALVVATVISFAISPLRRYGLVTLTLLAFIYPAVAVVALLFGVVAAALHYFHKGIPK